uniref:Uncharacterized protein n=1 Tax=Arundo donax TaxID=35708 RepID=A0A0A9BXE6_ARUDO
MTRPIDFAPRRPASPSRSIAGRRGGVAVGEDGLERGDDPGHVGADLGVLAEAVVGEACDALHAPRRVLPAHPPVHDPVQLLGPDQNGPGPVH